MHILYGFICILSGGLLTWNGQRILKPYRRPAGHTGFAGNIISRPLFKRTAGIAMVVIGLVLALVMSMIFFVTA
jgi:hypothetical protein